MADNGRRPDSVMQRLRNRSPAARQVVGFFALLATGGISACFGGIASTGVVIALLLGTPVFLFFSPILVPAGIIAFLCIGGVLAATTAGVAALSFASWLYNHLHKDRNVNTSVAINPSLSPRVQSKVQQFEAPAAAA